MNASVAISLVGRAEARADKCLAALEDVLHQCGGAVAGFPGVRERLLARREFKSHDIGVRDLSGAELANVLGGCRRVELGEGVDVRLVWSGEGRCADSDEDVSLGGVEGGVAAVRELLLRTVQGDAYRLRHGMRSLAIARDVAEGLRLHLGVLRGAGVIRRELLSRSLASIGTGAADRSWSDSLRARVSEGLNGLSREVSEALKRSFGPDGCFQHTLGPVLDRLRVEDLARDSSGKKAVRLSVREEFRVDLLRSIRDLTASEIGRVVDTVNAAVGRLDRAVSGGVPGARGHSGSGLGLSGALAQGSGGRDGFGSGGTLAAGMILERLEDSMQLSIRYRGVLPQRGFFHRLAEGRRSIFTVLMFFSLFGSFLGFNWRTVPVLGWLFLGGFVFAVVHTYRSWVEEDQERIEEELEKLRDLVQAELRRMLSELARESQAAVLEAIEQRRRMLLSWIDEGAKEAVARGQREVQAVREAAQLAVKQLDVRERQYVELLNAVTKVASELGSLCPKAAV